VIYNPANLEKFYQSDHSKSEQDRIFFAGTICEKKGIRQLVQALPIIKKEFPEVKLYIAGRDWFFNDGKSYAEYLKTFIGPELKDSIIFLGQVSNDEIPGLIEKSEVCVYPSHMEAMPLAWIEVLAMGKAFVGSNKGPGSEVVIDGVTGLLCDPLDPNDIAEKVIFMLRNKEKAREFGQNARNDILARFNLSVIVKKNIDFYTNLVK
jgi:glycosyltransferase involved in cell wall biosynthesis